MMNKNRGFLPSAGKLICFLMGLVLMAILLPFNAAADEPSEVVVTTEQQLREAVRYDGNVITIAGDIYITDEAIVIDREITLRGHGTLTSIDKWQWHFTVEEGGILTLDGDLALIRAQDSDSFGGIRVNNAKLVMHSGLLYGHYFSGGITLAENSSFYMYGGEIKNNYSRRGTGVAVVEESTFNMYDGLISGHTGNGVYVSRNSVFNMHGGVISDNSAGGGVVVYRSSIFNMYGGEISGNNALHGGGVSVSEGSEFFMHGGVISGNSAGFGGGVFISWCQWLRTSLFVFFEGSITNNTAQYQGGGIASRSHLVVYGGEITNNEANREGGGIYISTNAAYAFIQGVKISDNIAHRHGGGIYNGVGAILSIADSEITGNTALRDGGGLYTQNYHNLRIREDVIFRDNSSSRAHNFGIWAGSEQFPLIKWSGENSVPNTHLKNNHDISYTGVWMPSIWVACIVIALIIIAIKLTVTIYCLKKERKKVEPEQAEVGDAL